MIPRFVRSTASDWEAILVDLRAGLIRLERCGRGMLVYRVAA